MKTPRPSSARMRPIVTAPIRRFTIDLRRLG
jgi:hypothetical protein